MKNILIIVGSISASVLLLMTGFVLLKKHIYSRTDCERFNIDNIEVRTGINIPAIKANKCDCEEGNNSKRSKFVINTGRVDLVKYIVDNNFKEKNGQYINKGERDDTKWEAQLNSETAELIVQINYKK